MRGGQPLRPRGRQLPGPGPLVRPRRNSMAPQGAASRELEPDVHPWKGIFAPFPDNPFLLFGSPSNGMHFSCEGVRRQPRNLTD